MDTSTKPNTSDKVTEDEVDEEEEDVGKSSSTVVVTGSSGVTTTTSSPATPPAAAKPSPHTPSALQRIRTDIKSIFKDPPPGIFVHVDEKDITLLHALISGPEDTPYQFGFFWFEMRMPHDYPHRPPVVTTMTTGGGKVRLHPNLYRGGKVCLSILGTWNHGPGWSPAQSISSILISIQSLLNSRPFTSEPGFETPRNPRDVEVYNEIILHEVIRISVLETLEDTAYSKQMPVPLLRLARDVAPNFFASYLEWCNARLFRDGQTMNDPFGEERGCFCWKSLLARLEVVIEVYGGIPPPDDDDDDEDEE